MILLAGVAAGALNAVGGGGSFVAPLPGNATSAWVYRREIHALSAALDARAHAGQRGRRCTRRRLAAVVAVGIFLFAADVMGQPRELVVLLLGAVVGGYAGAHLVRRLPAAVLRSLVLTTAVALTALFFVRAAR